MIGELRLFEHARTMFEGLSSPTSDALLDRYIQPCLNSGESSSGAEVQ